VTDACFVHEVQVSTSSTCDGATPPFNRHRGVAGAPATNDVVKCQLEPLRASDYKHPLTPVELETLRAAFPTGVCDWSRPGQGQRAAGTWITFNAGPGGTELGPAPSSQPFNHGPLVRAARTASLPTTGGTAPVLALTVLSAALLVGRARRTAAPVS
jgi:hypothetical protein